MVRLVQESTRTMSTRLASCIQKVGNKSNTVFEFADNIILCPLTSGGSSSNSGTISVNTINAGPGIVSCQTGSVKVTSQGGGDICGKVF